jgi:tetratricopeptide (TPR) repeat protein
MGLTALAALAVGGPLAAATVAVAGRVLGQALGATSRELLKTFVGKTNDYFFDTTGEGLIDGFRVEHPTLEDVYRRAFELSLLSLRSPEQEAGKRNGNDGHAAEYDWFGHWEFALKSGIPFTATGIRLPRDDGEADAAFRAAMEILAAQGAQRLSGGISITLKTEALPDDLFRVLKEEVPAKLDFFFNSLLVQDENTTAWKEHDLVFKREFLASFAQLFQEVHEVKTDTTAIREEQAEQGKRQVADSEKLDAILKMLAGRFDAGIEAGNVPESALSEKDALIARQAEELEALRTQLSARAAEPAKAEPKDAELSAALANGDLDAALRLQHQQTESAGVDYARELYTLGKIHELRFEWPQALEAYRQSWERGGDPEYGFYYAWFAQKLNHFGEAGAVYEGLLRVHKEPTDRAMTLNNLAILYSDTQRMQEAERAYGEALAIRRKLAEANPDAYLPDVATTLNNFANLYRDTQRMQEAERAYGEALAIRRKLAEANPDAYLPYVAMTLNNLAVLYRATQRMQEAERAYGEALDLRRKLAEANPDAYLPDVAMTLNNLAILYRDTQRMQEAERAYGEALDLRRKLAEANPDAYLPNVATTLNNLAYLLLSDGRREEAGAHASEAMGILDPLWRANPALHGNLLARVLWTRALVAEARSEPEACGFARRGLEAAYDSELKQSIQEVIDRMCSGPAD